MRIPAISFDFINCDTGRFVASKCGAVGCGANWGNAGGCAAGGRSENCFVFAAMSRRSRSIICFASTSSYVVSTFIYRDKWSELAKSFLNSVDGFDAFHLQSYYRIGEAFCNGCRLCFALWNKWSKILKLLINKLDIIIHLDYLKGMEMHWNVWEFFFWFK